MFYMVGYVLAFISSLFFTLYVVPRKFSQVPPLIFSFLMSVSFLIGSVVLYCLQPFLRFHETWSFDLFYSVIAGVIWAASFVFFVRSIDQIGLSRSNQWKNLQGPIGVFLSLIFLGEWILTNPFLAGLAGIAIFLSAVCFTNTTQNLDKKVTLSSIYYALISGIGFGVVTVLNKYVTTHVGVYSQQVVWSLSIAVSLLVYILYSKDLPQKLFHVSLKEFTLGMIAGVFYLGASFFMLQSYTFIPASISFTIIQLNAVWTISIGILFFKEIDIRKYYKKVLLGLFFTIIGVALLVFARK